MNIQDLREAQAKYIKTTIDNTLESRKRLYGLRDKFTKRFSIKKISTMVVDEFVLGVPIPKNDMNFCYTIERELDGLGRIIGANAFKFGVYYGRIKNDSIVKYRHARKFGENSTEAFENVRMQILALLTFGRKKNFAAIAANPLSPMFKGKILSTYFPEDYLNVFSPNHLNYFLIKLDLDSIENLKLDAVYKREILREFKNNDHVMKNWSLDLFTDFLYTTYPGRPPKLYGNDEIPTELEDYTEPSFPENQQPLFIDLAFGDFEETFSKDNVPRKKKDYEKESRKFKLLGDRGEKIVMDIEFDRLVFEGRRDLAEKIERVSLKSDSYGYDIVSYNSDGSKKYIEVKATKGKIGKTRFYITQNELEKAKSLENYFVYIVYEVTTESPKVWNMQNPFKPQKRNLKLLPVKYVVQLKSIRI